ncbi:ECF transporter S component [Lagierella massiliensis]|uniref:ECF transporter S component n=1 Tax=Lagierella massiliensis TaxID=1689303 RepID=UPI0006D84747|nr:ECF transporter S component [Lagierella massiliensis]
MNIKKLVRIALLGAISGILMIALHFPLPMFPPFMDIDFGEVPALIAGFTMGPLAGFYVIIIKLIVKIIVQSTSTGFIGELSNLIVSSALVCISSYLYSKKKTVKNSIISLAIGVLAMAIIATISNYFFIFPLYGMDIPKYAKSFSKINPLVKNSATFLFIVIIPFNIIKGFLNSIVAIALLKPIEKYMNRA